MDNENKNTMRDMMKSNYGESKFDKSTELNESMSIESKEQDNYTKTVHNLNGGRE